MLSGETASGKYPVEAVRTMTKIALEVESSLDVSLEIKMSKGGKKIAATLARNMVEATNLLPVKAIVFDTWTGRTGRYIAEFRPTVPVYAMCYRDFIMRELSLFYGVFPYALEKKNSKEEMVEGSIDILKKDGKVLECDLLGFIGGSFASELGASYMEFKYV
jgi:pyruvate kinase